MDSETSCAHSVFPPTRVIPTYQQPVEFDGYQVLKRLHHTPTTKIYLVKGTCSSLHYALKVVEKAACKEGQLTQIFNEYCVLKSVSNDVQFTRLVRSWHDTKNFYCLLEYHPRNMADTLSEFTFDISRARVYAAGMVSALEVLHNNHILHRDLNTYNVFFRPDGQIVLGGLRSCKIFKRDKTVLDNLNFYVISDGEEPIAASAELEFMSPERLAGEEYSFEADVWSLGVIIYRMVAGRLPFTGYNVEELKKSVNADELCYPPERNIDPATQDLVNRLLCRDRTERLTDLVAIKEHPFFRFTEWDTIINRRTISPWKPPCSSNPLLRHLRKFLEITPGVPYDGLSVNPYPQFTFKNPQPVAPTTESLYPQAYRNLSSALAMNHKGKTRWSLTMGRRSKSHRQ